MNNFAVVILAAGASRRMGTPKLLLPWGETTVMGHLVQTWKEIGAREIGIVVSEASPETKGEAEKLAVPNCRCIENTNADGDMWSSIQAAAHYAKWNSEITHFLLCLGDQPHLRSECLSFFLSQTDAGKEGIWQPQIEGRTGHPVLFSRGRWQALAEAKSGPLNHWLEQNKSWVTGVPMTNPEMARDMDTREEYEVLLKSWKRDREWD
ncbi:MAG: hypothetical protein JWN25_2991 [Verrucomicrobiales bacterium]|nr:hypothetical protein [Verrucomicrobiales bacterium]